MKHDIGYVRFKDPESDRVFVAYRPGATRDEIEEFVVDLVETGVDPLTVSVGNCNDPYQEWFNDARH